MGHTLRLVRKDEQSRKKDVPCSFCGLSEPRYGCWFGINNAGCICDACVERMFFQLFEVYRRKFRKVLT